MCLICVFAASMSSEANRKYLVNSVRILSGNDSQFITDNEESNERANTEESDAYADIEEKLGVKLPEFYYRPSGMEFLDYSINMTMFYATLEYKYKENIVILYINRQDDSTVSNASSLNGEKQIVEKMNKDNVDVIINEMNDQTDKNPTYIASWEYKNVVYYFNGKIQLEELKKIIKYMKF